MTFRENSSVQIAFGNPIASQPHAMPGMWCGRREEVAVKTDAVRAKLRRIQKALPAAVSKKPVRQFPENVVSDSEMAQVRAKIVEDMRRGAELCQQALVELQAETDFLNEEQACA